MNKQTPRSKILLEFLRELGLTAIDLKDLAQAIGRRRGGAWLKGGSSYIQELKYLQDHKKLQQTVNQLRHSKYLLTTHVDQSLLISLTDKGKTSTLIEQLRHAKPQTGNLDTVVIFDIPRSHNWVRKQFRQLLKQGGFVKLQQSVWLSNKDCYDIVARFVKQLKMENWVNILRARDLLHRPKLK